MRRVTSSGTDILEPLLRETREVMQHYVDVYRPRSDSEGVAAIICHRQKSRFLQNVGNLDQGLERMPDYWRDANRLAKTLKLFIGGNPNEKQSGQAAALGRGGGAAGPG